MKSKTHSELQDKAIDYLLAKSYWISTQEMPTLGGIIDVWGISRALDYITCAIEVKVSKQDHRSRSQKDKEYNSGAIANTNYILCPAGLIQPEEVNPYWGLLWYEEGKRLMNKKQPKFFEQTDREKLGALIHLLSSGININKPKIISGANPKA